MTEVGLVLGFLVLVFVSGFSFKIFKNKCDYLEQVVSNLKQNINYLENRINVLESYSYAEYEDSE